MSDMGETFRILKQQQQIKRASNRTKSKKILEDVEDLTFVVKNEGAHLIVYYLDKVVDFWPGTGLWIVRHSKMRGRGVYNMLKHIGA